MATTIHPHVSKKNPYYISKHRYYELKHFCLQYPEWKKEYSEITLTPKHQTVKVQNSPGDPTANLAIRRTLLLDRMKLVEQSAIEADSSIYVYILLAVTTGLSYDALQTTHQIPCGREYYYIRYRRFFYILSRDRR